LSCAEVKNSVTVCSSAALGAGCSSARVMIRFASHVVAASRAISVQSPHTPPNTRVWAQLNLAMMAFISA